MNELIQFFVRQGYSLEEAKALSNEYIRQNSAQFKQAAPEWEHNPYVISAEQKQRQDKFIENKNKQADALAFGMTPHKNQAAANAGAEDLASNIFGTMLLETLTRGIVQPAIRAFNNSPYGTLWNMAHNRFPLHFNNKLQAKVIQLPQSPRIFINPSIGTPASGTYDQAKALELGQNLASKLFGHPVTVAAHKHNQELAAKLGIPLSDIPSNIHDIIEAPVTIESMPFDGTEVAHLAQGYLGDPRAILRISDYPMTQSVGNGSFLHEFLHRGYYGSPVRPKIMDQNYFNNFYNPQFQFWNWKVSKILKPNYQGTYLGDVLGGELAVNLIEVGRHLGVKIGSPYPGDKVFFELIKQWPRHKRFMLNELQLETRAGRRHVWDAMAGKYFGQNINNKPGNIIYDNKA